MFFRRNGFCGNQKSTLTTFRLHHILILKKCFPKDCIPCVLKNSCTPKSLFKRIFTTTYEDYYHRAYERQHSRQGKQMKRLRQSTIEPVFGSLVHHYGLSKINVLGKAAAHKVMLMSAICFNLKKYLKTFNRKLVKSAWFSVDLLKSPRNDVLTFTHHKSPASSATATIK